MNEIHARLIAALLGEEYVDLSAPPAKPPALVTILHETAVSLPPGIHETLIEALGGERASKTSSDVHTRLAAALLTVLGAVCLVLG